MLCGVRFGIGLDCPFAKASKNDAFQIIGRVALRKESKLADKAEALVLKSLASP